MDDTNIKQSVHIHKCENCTVQVKGKVNEILIGTAHAISPKLSPRMQTSVTRFRCCLRA